jgi:predicted nucleic acid-binding Zn ribbon protein
MAEQPSKVEQTVEDHRHCIVCGKPTTSEKFFCSPACEDVFKTQQKKMKKSRTLMMVLFIVMFVVMIALTSLRGSGTAATTLPATGWKPVDSWAGTGAAAL